MATPLVAAIWRGPYDGELLGGRVLCRGEQVDVTERDLESAHWERVKPAKAPKATENRSDS